MNTREKEIPRTGAASSRLGEHAYPRIERDKLTVLEPRYTGTLTPIPYVAAPQLVAIAEAAFRRRRPLLLVGEPGVGKSKFAYAVARSLHALGFSTRAEPYVCVVRSDTRARDLFYRYDSLNRFGDAQSSDEAMRRRARDTRNYIDLQPLGQAFASGEWCVVLIDEIDKAIRDLPNDLLDALEEERFEIPEIATDEERREDPEYFRDTLKLAARQQLSRELRLWPEEGGSAKHEDQRVVPGRGKWPLIVVTSNSERQLPKPFLRRCFFHEIDFPESTLGEILRPRCPELPKPHFDALVKLIGTLRQEELEKRPCLSEAMDFLSELSELHRRDPRAKVFADVKGWADTTVSKRFDWSLLDHLGCLVKLKNDRDRLLKRAAYAPG